LFGDFAMMLIALKKLSYPRGRNAVEYQAGDSFKALSERDAFALTAVKAAKAAPSRAAKKTLSLKPAGEASVSEETSGQYGRRDMRAEG